MQTLPKRRPQQLIIGSKSCTSIHQKQPIWFLSTRNYKPEIYSPFKIISKYISNRRTNIPNGLTQPRIRLSPTGSKSMLIGTKVLSFCLAHVAGSIEEAGDTLRIITSEMVHRIRRNVNQSSCHFNWHTQSTGPCLLQSVEHVVSSHLE